MLRTTVLPRAKLWEYFCVDVEVIVKEFKTTVCHLNGGEHARPEGKALVIIQDPQYRRLGSTVDASLTLELFNIFQYVYDYINCVEYKILPSPDNTIAVVYFSFNLFQFIIL